MSKLALPIYTVDDNAIKVFFPFYPRLGAPEYFAKSRAENDIKTNQPEFKSNLVHL